MSKGGVSGISGVSESRAALIIAELIKDKKVQILVIEVGHRKMIYK